MTFDLAEKSKQSKASRAKRAAAARNAVMATPFWRGKTPKGATGRQLAGATGTDILCQSPSSCENYVSALAAIETPSYCSSACARIAYGTVTILDAEADEAVELEEAA